MQIGLHSLIFCYTFLVETEEFLSQLVSGNGNFSSSLARQVHGPAQEAVSQFILETKIRSL